MAASVWRIFQGEAEVKANALGVPQMQVAIGLGGKTRDDPAAATLGSDIGGDHFADKILGSGDGRIRHSTRTSSRWGGESRRREA